MRSLFVLCFVNIKHEQSIVKETLPSDYVSLNVAIQSRENQLPKF